MLPLKKRKVSEADDEPPTAAVDDEELDDDDAHLGSGDTKPAWHSDFDLDLEETKTTMENLKGCYRSCATVLDGLGDFMTRGAGRVPLLPSLVPTQVTVPTRPVPTSVPVPPKPVPTLT